MNRLIKWWSGYVLVELSGYSLERLINLCGYNHIQLWDVVYMDGKYRFYVHRRDFKQLTVFVRKSKTRLIVLEKHGLPFGIRRHRNHKWFATGIPICLVLLYMLSLHIWEIDFDGNYYFTDELLQKTLREEGYDTGMRKNSVVCDDLEMRLREIYPEITWVSAQITGTRLYIQIRENTGILTVDETEEVPCDLVAACDGVITEIITRSGTPMVRAGDTVTTGQVLVSGVVELHNDSKEKTGEFFVAADADILAQTKIPYEDRFDMEYPVKWYTGEQRHRLTLSIFNRQMAIDLTGMKKTLDIQNGTDIRFSVSQYNMENVAEEADTFWYKLFQKLHILKKIPFLYDLKCYDIVTTQGQLCLRDAYVFPVKWQLSTLREYEEITAIYSKQQAFSLAEDNCAKFFEKLLEKGVQIIEKNVRIDMIGGECVTDGTVTVIQPIGQPVPIAQNMGDQEEISN